MALLRGSIAIDRFATEYSADIRSSFADLKSGYPADTRVEWNGTRLSVVSEQSGEPIESLSVPTPAWLTNVGVRQSVFATFIQQTDAPQQHNAFATITQEQTHVHLDGSLRTVPLSELLPNQSFTLNSENKDALLSQAEESVFVVLENSFLLRAGYSLLFLLTAALLFIGVEVALLTIVLKFLNSNEWSLANSIVLGLWLGMYAQTVQTLVFLLHPQTPAWDTHWLSASFWLAALVVLLSNRRLPIVKSKK